jgi:hypothetical protein
MYLGDKVNRFVAFLRAGYPAAMPSTGYVPLAALLPRRLSNDEIAAISNELTLRGRYTMSSADVGVRITRITDDLPSPDDIERVRCQLEVRG